MSDRPGHADGLRGTIRYGVSLGANSMAQYAMAREEHKGVYGIAREDGRERPYPLRGHAVNALWAIAPYALRKCRVNKPSGEAAS
jgi:hypothetical protein